MAVPNLKLAARQKRWSYGRGGEDDDAHGTSTNYDDKRGGLSSFARHVPLPVSH